MIPVVDVTMKISLAGAVIEYGSLMAEHMVEAIRPDDSISGSLWIARELDDWLKTCDASPLVALRGFAENLKNEIKDLDLESVEVPPICSINIVDYLSHFVDINLISGVAVYSPDVNLEVRNPMFADNEAAGVRADRKMGDRAFSRVDGDTCTGNRGGFSEVIQRYKLI